MLTLAVVLLNAFGNLALAWGMKHRDAVSANPLDYIQALFDPFVALGVGLLILWLLTRMTLMSWADLSFVIPMTAVGYLLSALFGHIFLGEHISPLRWLATLLIVVGHRPGRQYAAQIQSSSEARTKAALNHEVVPGLHRGLFHCARRSAAKP